MTRIIISKRPITMKSLQILTQSYGLFQVSYKTKERPCHATAQLRHSYFFNTLTRQNLYIIFRSDAIPDRAFCYSSKDIFLLTAAAWRYKIILKPWTLSGQILTLKRPPERLLNNAPNCVMQQYWRASASANYNLNYAPSESAWRLPDSMPNCNKIYSSILKNCRLQRQYTARQTTWFWVYFFENKIPDLRRFPRCSIQSILQHTENNPKNASQYTRFRSHSAYFFDVSPQDFFFLWSKLTRA